MPPEMSKEAESVYAALAYRGFLKQVTSQEAVTTLLDHSVVPCYVGFDPSADSLHVGSLIPIMALAHLQRAGHIPIVVLGGGTAMVGDPSGKTEMRQMLSSEEIGHNIVQLKEQLSRYLDFSEGRGMLLDNADWLLSMHYIDFLREVGVHFRVNDMVRSEGYRQRMQRQTGLSFIEFNYQLLQAFDFWVLHQRHQCCLQLGGDDQWGNILAGVELVRRAGGAFVEGMTFPLITTASGAKMGKTADGAVWLSESKTTPYDFYQYWVNCDDRDVISFLKYFTFLPQEEIDAFAELQAEQLRCAKQTLAFEVTRLCHGEAAAQKAQQGAEVAFGSGENIDALPTSQICRTELQSGIGLPQLLKRVGLCASASEAARLVLQGGIYVNRVRIQDKTYCVNLTDVGQADDILIRKGKKVYHRIQVV